MTATLDVVASGASAPTPVDLGGVGRGSSVRTGELSGCPCVVRDLQLSPVAGARATVTGDVVLRRIEVRRGGSWQPIADATNPARWVDTTDQQVAVETTDRGLHWSFFAPAGTPPTLVTHDRPDPLPGVAARDVAAGSSEATVNGLNGSPLPVRFVGRAPAVPGAPTTGVVVDLSYAQRAAFGDVAPSTAQVWVRGPLGDLRSALAEAGFPVVDVRTSAEARAELARQGPALASVLFVADAAAAAVLAALAAVLSLYAAARRRRYEYAALAATGASRRTLFTALGLEQVVVIGFGAVTGVAAGVLSVAVAGRSIPEFVAAPAAVLLTHRPPLLPLTAGIVGAVAVLIAGAALAAATLLRSVDVEQLREAPA